VDAYHGVLDLLLAMFPLSPNISLMIDIREIPQFFVTLS
jgi:hypothetical protein